MELAPLIRKRDLTYEQAAAQIGDISRSYLQCIAAGTKPYLSDTAARIIAWGKGEISLEELDAPRRRRLASPPIKRRRQSHASAA